MLPAKNNRRYLWLYDILLVLVLELAGYLRVTGLNWGEGEHQHPDENFLSGVLGSLQAHKCTDETIPVEACPADQRRWISLGDYFDSQTSTLNPYNRGQTFFVYGNLPLTIVRVVAEATASIKVDEVELPKLVEDLCRTFPTCGRIDTIKLLGRQFSALADLFTILILYFIVARLYDRRVALLAALFSALTVMQIQQSHFFTTDLFVNPFAFLAIYFAVEIMLNKEQRTETGNVSDKTTDGSQLTAPVAQFPELKSLLSDPLFLSSLGFGVAYGMALASKVNIYPLAILLPGAFALRYLINKNQDSVPHEVVQQNPADDSDGIIYEDGGTQPMDMEHLQAVEPVAARAQRSVDNNYWLLITACLIAGGLTALISFRIFQPYAFDGLLPSQQWIANIREQRVQATGGADLPWELQWARRTHL